MARSYVVIDSDAHVIEPGDLWLRFMDKSLRDRAPQQLEPGGISIRIDGEVIPPNNILSGAKITSTTLEKYKKAAARNFGPESQVDAMDEEGIDLAVMFPTVGLLVMGTAHASAEITTAAASAYNSWLAEFCAGGSSRLFGVGMIDPRNVDAACREAERCVKTLGFVGLFLRPNPVMGRPFHDPVYEPLWSCIESLDVPICFHEGSAVALPQIGPDRFGDRINLWHMSTHVVENQLAMVSMVLGGVCERHPRLRCGFMECGAGWLPYWMWRMDEHAETALRHTGNEIELAMTPSDYVKRQCYVSADTEEDTSINTMERLGGSNVLWASDYPHSDAKYPRALRTVTQLPGITPFLEQVMATNPKKFFGPALRAAADRR